MPDAVVFLSIDDTHEDVVIGAMNDCARLGGGEGRATVRVWVVLAVHILASQLREERGSVGGTEGCWSTDSEVFDRRNRRRSSGIDT